MRVAKKVGKRRGGFEEGRRRDFGVCAIDISELGS